MRPSLLGFLLCAVLCIFLQGCDNWCRGKKDVCGAGEKYYGWPDCDCLKEDTSDSGSTSRPRAQWEALAICKTDAGSGIMALWRTKPSYWGQYPTDVTIRPYYTGMSAALNYCPMYGPNKTQSAVGNAIHARIETWQHWESLISDDQYVAAYGTALRPMAANAVPPDDQVASLTLPARVVGHLQFAMIAALLQEEANLSIDQCVAECTGNTAQCLEEVPLRNEFNNGLARLIHRIETTSEPRISKDDVLDMFGEDKDPCDRSDLVLSDGEIRNDGRACYLDAIEESGGLKPSVWIEIPEYVAATPERRTDEAAGAGPLDYVVKFESPDAAPSIGASNDKDYVRGPIKAAGYRDRHLYLLLPGGCVLAQVSKSHRG